MAATERKAAADVRRLFRRFHIPFRPRARAPRDDAAFVLRLVLGLADDSNVAHYLSAARRAK